MLSNRRSLPVAIAALALAATSLTGSASAYVGGHDALSDKPFVTGIRTAGAASPNFFCTGTLVHAEWILTAAHCLDGGRQASQLEVVIGDTSLLDSGDPAEVRLADAIELHPDWGGDPGDRNDVAMIHLTAPSTIAPVRLGSTPALAQGIAKCAQLAAASGSFGYLVAQNCVSGRGKALGWGRTSMSAPTTSDTLREVTPKILGGPRNTFWRAKAAACPGDSGGPLLVLAADGSPRQIGVASFNQHGGGYFDWLVGDQCSTKGTDSYSDVAAGTLRTWVESITRVRDHRS